MGLFDWFAERRRRKILAQPFPTQWLDHIRENVGYYAYLDGDERERLCRLVQVFVREKRWEGGGGLEIDDEIKVTIAAQACVLILARGHRLYRGVKTIIVYATTVLVPPPIQSVLHVPTDVAPDSQAIYGQAWLRGPVILVWDSVLRGGRDAAGGSNVVFHEFAHKLDMLDGAADGVPPLAHRRDYARWMEVVEREYEQLGERTTAGEPTMLGSYAHKNAAEFFAVATEHFFEQPVALLENHPDLYGVLADYYGQDTAARAWRLDAPPNQDWGYDF